MSLGYGFGVGLRGVAGEWVFLWKIREKREGGGGIGTGKGTGKSLTQCASFVETTLERSAL